MKRFSGPLGIVACFALVLGLARCEERVQDDLSFVISEVAGLSTNEVTTMAAQAANYARALDPNNSVAITVVDREGRVLIEFATVAANGVSAVTDASAANAGNALNKGGLDLAVSESRAMTASYLSSTGEAFTAQTAFFIIQENFPPGTKNEDVGPLFGVENSNFPASDVIAPSRFDVRDDVTRPARGLAVRSLQNNVADVTDAPFVARVHPSITNGTNTNISQNVNGEVGRNAISAGIVGIVTNLFDQNNAGVTTNFAPNVLGGIPLHRLGNHVGGIGVAGSGAEENLDIALFGQFHFQPPELIRANRVFVDGIRFPYTRTNFRILNNIGTLTLAELIDNNLVHLVQGPRSTLEDGPTDANFNRQVVPDAYRLAAEQTQANATALTGISDGVAAAATLGLFFDAANSSNPNMTVAGTSNIGADLRISVTIKDTLRASPNEPTDLTNDVTTTLTRDFRQVPIDLPPSGVIGVGRGPLTLPEVSHILRSALEMSLSVRAGIRRPLGLAAVVHVCVVDQNGRNLGTIALDDATVFSYDVALQKARTCAFFSDGAVAYAARSIGWLAQPHFPPGIDTTAPGPLFGMQAIYNPNGNLLHPAMNGFEVFPGGLPIFKSGILVGGVGISGDGVDQDDQIAFGGQLPPFSAPTNVRCDVVDEVFVVSSLRDFGLSKMRNATDAAIGRIDGNIAAPIAITGLAPTGAALGIARGQLVALRDLIDAKRVELQDPGRLTGVPIPWFKFARKPNLFDSK